MKVKFLLNPFERIAGWKALTTGLAVMALTALAGVYSGIGFKGVLDVHIYETSISMALICQIVNLLSITLLMWLGALLLFKSRSLRLVDVAGTLALARAPYLLAALFGFLSPLMTNMVYVISFSLFAIVVIIWTVALMYNACAVSCHLKGTKGTIFFIVGVILAEVLSIAVNVFVVRKFAIFAVASSLSLVTPVQEPTVQELDLSDIHQTAVTIVNAFAQEDFAKITTFFDTTMKKAMSEKQLRLAWVQVQLGAGKLQKADTTSITEQDYQQNHQQYKILLIPCTFETSVLKIQLVFNKEGQISGLFFKP
ncbi:MAG: DUF3887 domain-containing protein [Bacteroidales bacterium]|jgi:hypothetical protein|nr:DUF3887 domain-containing protein [Bacteroidales bacterium]